jgi:hypothetical protein
MRKYHAVPTYLMEFWWNFLPCLGWLKDGTFHLCLSYLASSFKINQREYDTMVHQH